jgi:hypothetical protein
MAVIVVLILVAVFTYKAPAARVEQGQSKTAYLRASITNVRNTVWKWQDDRLPPMHVSFNTTPSETHWRVRRVPGATYFRTPGTKSYLSIKSPAWLRWDLRYWQHLRHREYLTRVKNLNPYTALKTAFGSHYSESLGVSRCETGGRIGWVTAGVGKHSYWGTMQMGPGERSRYGFSWTALGQAVSARRYFNVEGWRPWQCLPSGGLRW